MANVALEIDGGHGLAERDDHDDAIYRLPLSRPWPIMTAAPGSGRMPQLPCLVGSAWGSPHLHALLRADHDVHCARLPMKTKLRFAVQRHHNARAESKKEKSACCACDLAPAYALSGLPPYERPRTGRHLERAWRRGIGEGKGKERQRHPAFSRSVRDALVDPVLRKRERAVGRNER